MERTQCRSPSAIITCLLPLATEPARLAWYIEVTSCLSVATEAASWVLVRTVALILVSDKDMRIMRRAGG